MISDSLLAARPAQLHCATSIDVCWQALRCSVSAEDSLGIARVRRLRGLGIGSIEALWFVPAMVVGMLLHRAVNGE